MSEQPSSPGSGSGEGPTRLTALDGLADLPEPRPVKRRWTAWLIWLVPLAALGVAMYYARSIAADRGPVITVRVADAVQIEPGKTQVRARGVVIGKVTDVRLADDRSGATATLRLHRDAKDFATDGARFWLVKPDFTGGSFSGLSTVLSGSYFDAIPGQGQPKSDFDALPRKPVSEGEGFRIHLFATDLHDIAPGASVMYRGVRVGGVVASQLAEDATHVVITVSIRRRYAPLVRSNSVFWFETPADIKGGIFSGLEVKLGTLRSLLSAGIKFASPADPLGRQAIDGSSFALLSERPDGVAGWRPEIAIDPGPSDLDESGAQSEADDEPMPRR